jgi:hypothetical protein
MSQLTGRQDLGNGFTDCGIAAPVADSRGAVATTDGAGRDVVLIWLYDSRGGYALLLVAVADGTCAQFATPFDSQGDCPYASLLSTGNKYYTAFASHFLEFDPAQRAFTHVAAVPPQMGMAMTQDRHALIWTATYPNCGLFSFDPDTRELRDYGYINQENWAQYPRSVAVGDDGWVYVGLGTGASGVFAFHPATREVRPILAPAERERGESGEVYRDRDGRVYGLSAAGRADGWYELSGGAGRRLGRLDHEADPEPIVTGDQGLVYGSFPDGKQIAALDLRERRLVVQDPQTEGATEITLDYATEGQYLMAVAALPDGSLCGGSLWSPRFFRYNPTADTWIRGASFGQWNALTEQAGHLFVGAYHHGWLLDWDPQQPWVPTQENDPHTNPVILFEAAPVLIRPTCLLACPDGKTIIMAGTPAYGHTGGGLLFWNRETRTATLLPDTQVAPDQSTESLVPLPGGKLLGGTTTEPGTGGEKKTELAELYVMDLADKSVEWRQAVLPGVQTYTDLCLGAGGLVYGLADSRRFFVWDPTARRVVHQEDTERVFGRAHFQQGPRVFVPGEGEEVYALFEQALARVDPISHHLQLVALSPLEVSGGGAYAQGRLYFFSGSHLISYAVAG